MLKHVRLAMQSEPEFAPTWPQLTQDFMELTTLTPELESLLEEVIAFKGKLTLDGAGGFPHRMSPEDMVKSFAVQIIRRTKPDAFPEIRL